MGVTVGIIVSIVEVGITAAGRLVGTEVGLTTGIAVVVAVQALRRKRLTMMSFFIESNYMLLAQATIS